MTSMRSMLAALAAAAVAGCPGPDDGERTTGDSAGGTGSATDPTDSETSGMDSTASASGGSATSTTGPTTAGNDSATSTTGDAEGACMDYCQHVAECFPEEQELLGLCLEECTFISEEGDAACQSAYADFFECVAMVDCAEFEGSQPHCVAEEEAIDATCTGDDACEGYVGMGEGGCEYGEICPDGDRRMFCDTATSTCTCYENDVEVGSCPLDQSCEDLDITDHAATCCGWEV